LKSGSGCEVASGRLMIQLDLAWKGAFSDPHQGQSEWSWTLRSRGAIYSHNNSFYGLYLLEETEDTLRKLELYQAPNSILPVALLGQFMWFSIVVIGSLKRD